MKLRPAFVRLVWRLVTVLPLGETVTIPSSRFQVFTSWEELEASGLVDPLIQAYQEVFRASDAWREDHPTGEVRERLQSELAAPAAIALKLGNAEWPVAGFCWGQILTVPQIIEASREAPSFHGVAKEEWVHVESALCRFAVGRTLFIHEIGVLHQFRGGIDTLRFLFRPVLEMGTASGVKSAIWWTNRRSEAYPLSLTIGFEPVVEVNGLVYLHTPDFCPILKAASRFDSRKIVRLFAMVRRRRKKRS